MDLLSYREAARIAQRSAAALHKAVKAGALRLTTRDGKSGFDVKDVREWSNRRWTAEETAVATETVHSMWTGAAVRISAFFGMTMDAGERQRIIEEGVFRFVELMLRNDDNRYCFSEGVRFQREGYLKNAIEICGEKYKDGLTNDFEIRYLYSIYHFLEVSVPLLYGDLLDTYSVQMTIQGRVVTGSDLAFAGTFSEFMSQLEKRGLFPQ